MFASCRLLLPLSLSLLIELPDVLNFFEQKKQSPHMHVCPPISMLCTIQRRKKRTPLHQRKRMTQSLPTCVRPPRSTGPLRPMLLTGLANKLVYEFDVGKLFGPPSLAVPTVYLVHVTCYSRCTTR